MYQNYKVNDQNKGKLQNSLTENIFVPKKNLIISSKFKFIQDIYYISLCILAQV